MSSKYIVVMFGYLNRGERMNVAVMSWDFEVGVPVPPETPVYQRVIGDWTRIEAAFPRAGSQELRDDVITRLANIRTYADYEKVLSKMGPYTPFEFTEERGSTVMAAETLASMAEYFIGPY